MLHLFSCINALDSKKDVYMMKIENESKVYLTTKFNFSMHSFDIKMNYRINLPALIINVIILDKLSVTFLYQIDLFIFFDKIQI